MHCVSVSLQPLQRPYVNRVSLNCFLLSYKDPSVSPSVCLSVGLLSWLQLELKPHDLVCLCVAVQQSL